jgi:flagellar hook assembly protein FlgD
MGKLPSSGLGLASPEINLSAFPNPTVNSSTIRYSVDQTSQIRLVVYDSQGRMIKTLVDKKHQPGTYTIQWDNNELAKGSYIITAIKNGEAKQVLKIAKN